MMNQKKLSLFGFFALTASMVLTVYEYPTFATSKLHLVFFLLLGGLLWFLPVALCAAEMATVEGWKNGGIFSWVSQTLGERFGFAAIFFQWFQITVGFVTMIYFILGALSYVLNFQALNTDPLIKFIGLLIIFWGFFSVYLNDTTVNGRIDDFFKCRDYLTGGADTNFNHSLINCRKYQILLFHSCPHDRYKYADNNYTGHSYR